MISGCELNVDNVYYLIENKRLSLDDAFNIIEDLLESSDAVYGKDDKESNKNSKLISDILDYVSERIEYAISRSLSEKDLSKFADSFVKNTNEVAGRIPSILSYELRRRAYLILNRMGLSSFSSKVYSSRAISGERIIEEIVEKEIDYDNDLTSKFRNEFVSKTVSPYVFVEKKSSHMNAYTIVGLENKKYESKDKVYDKIMKFNDYISIVGYSDNKKPIIEVVNSNKIKPILVVTGKLRKKFSDRELFAILFHELGHWSRRGSYVFGSLLLDAVVALLIIVLSIVTFLYTLSYFLDVFSGKKITGNEYRLFLETDVFLVVTRWVLSLIYMQSEVGADKFAVESGYGKELYRSLRYLHNKKRGDFDNLVNENVVVRAFKTVFWYIMSIIRSFFVFLALDKHPNIGLRGNIIINMERRYRKKLEKLENLTERYKADIFLCDG